MELTRSSLINTLAVINNYTSYLEIGYGTGLCFHEVSIPQKVGIDIGYGVPNDDLFCHTTTSQKLLEKATLHNNPFLFDLIFIDGSHLCEDVLVDVVNASQLLSHNGAIVLHDCLPPTEDWQLRSQSPNVPGWMGDVWRTAACCLQSSLFTGFTIDSDCGMTILYKNSSFASTDLPLLQPLNITWEDWFSSRTTTMNIISPSSFLANLRPFTYSSIEASSAMVNLHLA